MVVTAAPTPPAFTLTHLGLSEDDFRTQSRAKIHEMLRDVARKVYPPVGHEEIDARLAEAFEGADYSEEEDARELAEWVKSELDVDVPAETLTGITLERARDLLWSTFDRRYRPEMRRMERSLVLNQLDATWKNHLYTMDHLRSGIGLVGYAQIDPKTEYKRQGMREFDSMWEGLQDKVSDLVFRMEDDAESFGEAVWSIGAAVHESAGSTIQSMRAQAEQQTMANTGEGKKQEPIRNRQQKVGRNDPCPCGSGKKYKNCCMRKAG
jgi:preprotein translocase subunit SecA